MSQYDPFRYSNLSPQMVSDIEVGKVAQTPALLAQYDVNNDGTISAVDRQIIQNNQNQMVLNTVLFLFLLIFYHKTQELFSRHL